MTISVGLVFLRLNCILTLVSVTPKFLFTRMLVLEITSTTYKSVSKLEAITWSPTNIVPVLDDSVIRSPYSLIDAVPTIYESLIADTDNAVATLEFAAVKLL